MSYADLPPDDIFNIALKSDYKTLMSICKSSRENYELICNNNYFWKLKTYHDFEDLYDIEPTTNVYGVADLYGDYGPDWYETYQYYRSVFSKEFIEALKADPKDEDLISIMIYTIDKKVFLIVDETDDEGNTALMVASAKGYRDIVQFLLSSKEGADPNIQNNNGSTALISASGRGHTETVRVLLEAGADPDIQNNYGWTALWLASGDGHTEIVRVLLEAGANPDIQISRSRKTALMIASEDGHTEIVRALLEAGADPNMQDKYGWTALMHASYEGRADVVPMLLEAGADPDIQDDGGDTALIHATVEPQVKIIWLLIRGGANPTILNNQSKGAIDFAIHSSKIKRMLRSAIIEHSSYNS